MIAFHVYRHDPGDEKETGDNEFEHLNPYTKKDYIWKPSRNAKMSRASAEDAIRNWWKAGSEVKVFDRNKSNWYHGHVVMDTHWKLVVDYIVYVDNGEISKRTTVRRADKRVVRPELSLIWHVMEYGVESLYKLEEYEEKEHDYD